MPITADRPLAIFYEHPEWFKPLFSELERRGIPYERIHAASHRYDPAEPPRYSLVFNRMSPSAYNRGAGNAIFHTTSFLAHLEEWGVPVVNGHAAWLSEISKAFQLSLLRRLGLPYPRARVIDAAEQAPAAAEGLRFPIVVKPNIGGSGAGVTRFDSPDELQSAVRAGTVSLGIDSTALVQEFIPQEQGRIVRVEVLDGKYLYGIRIYTPGNSFDLCPADVCQRVDGTALDAAVCAVDAPSRGLRVEGYEPPAAIVRDVERIIAGAGIDVGGVEYMIDERDGQLYYYDINALSNFVADAPNVVGFDPVARLVDFLVARAQSGAIGGEEAA
jgi:biotin carboxylase